MVWKKTYYTLLVTFPGYFFTKNQKKYVWNENLLPKIIHFPIYSLIVDRFQSYLIFEYVIIWLLNGWKKSWRIQDLKKNIHFIMKIILNPLWYIFYDGYRRNIYFSIYSLCVNHFQSYSIFEYIAIWLLMGGRNLTKLIWNSLEPEIVYWK